MFTSKSSKNLAISKAIESIKILTFGVTIVCIYLQHAIDRYVLDWVWFENSALYTIKQDMHLSGMQ